MDTTEWLIAATVAAPVLTTLVSPGFTAAVIRLARTRAQRVKHVPVSGTDLYNSGVPMTEAQFREVFAAFQAALDALPPAGERNEQDMQRQFEAARQLAVLAGTHPQAFPSFGDPDQAWEWYAENNPYVTGRTSAAPLAPGGRRALLSPWQRLRNPAR
jgi:hypothetical protein